MCLNGLRLPLYGQINVNIILCLNGLKNNGETMLFCASVGCSFTMASRMIFCTSMGSTTIMGIDCYYFVQSQCVDCYCSVPPWLHCYCFVLPPWLHCYCFVQPPWLVQCYFSPFWAKLQNTRPLVIFHCVAIFSVATATQSRAIKLQYQGNTSLYQCLVLLKTHCCSRVATKNVPSLQLRNYINVSFFQKLTV